MLLPHVITQSISKRFINWNVACAEIPNKYLRIDGIIHDEYSTDTNAAT